MIKQNHRRAKLSYSFSSQWRKNSGELKILPAPKAKGSHMPLVRAEYHSLLRRVTTRRNQGRNHGGQRAQYPRRRITEGAEWLREAPKSPNNVTSTAMKYQWSTFASERPEVRTWSQTCFLSLAPSNLVTPLAVIQFSALSIYTWSEELHNCIVSKLGHNCLN